jgi:hypothetical protein
MLKYLKGAPLKVVFAGRDITLPCPLVADFDILNPILRGCGSTSIEVQQLRNEAVMALADRLIERAKLEMDVKTAIEAHNIAFYFQFGIELDLYLPALFPNTESAEDDTPLAPPK